MARKKDVVKKIDQKTSSVGAPLPLIQEDQPAPPAFYVIPAPDTLIEVSQAIQRSTQAPLVAVAIAWQEAPNIAPDYYNVEYSEDSGFNDVQKRRANQISATIDSLKANGITYYFRVQAVLGGIYSDYSNTLTVVTMTDDTPPPEVTGANAVFENSDLALTYTIPISEILKDVEIKIYNSGHTILYGTFYTRTSKFIWTAEQNIFATGGVPLKQVSVDIHTRSWTNQLSLTGVNVTATAPLPSTPTGYASNWISDTGTSAADFVSSWATAANAEEYELSIDGKTFVTRDLKFVYTYEQNVTDHRPTLASGNPSFVWLLKARDKLGQASTPVNVTVANIAPPSGVMNMTIVPGLATLGITIALLGNTIVQDFDHFEYALTSGSTVVQRFNSPDTSILFQVNAAGTYTPTVRMVDKFNQKSATLSGAPQVLDVLTINELRAETIYTDSFNTNFAVAGTVFKDGVLYTGSIGNAIRYATTSGTWNWVKASRPLLDRYRTNTVAFAWPTTSRIYFEYNNGSVSTYYAAPVTVSSVGTKTLTNYPLQADARTNAIALGAAGNTGVNASFRYDTIAIEEARNVTLWFQTDGGNFDLYEWYPRRLVQSDDVETESLNSINIKAAGINADRLFVVSLAALTAGINNLHIDTLLDIASTGIIFQGSGSGTLLQNATTPTSFNVTGLKIYNSGGVGRLATYNAGVEQVVLDTDGRLKAGAGNVVLDANGIVVIASTSYLATRSYGFTDGTNRVADLYGIEGASAHSLNLTLSSKASRDSAINIFGDAPTGKISQIILTARVNSVAGAQLTLSNGGASPGVRIDNADFTVLNGNIFAPNKVSVGGLITATRALSIFGDNQYLAFNNTAGTEKWVLGLETASSGRFAIYNNATAVYGMLIDATNSFAQFNSIGAGIAGQTNVRIYARGQDATSSNYAFYADNSGGGLLLAARNDGNVYISSDLYSNNVKVLGQRITGWNAPTTGGGALLRGTFDTAATLVTTARTLAALIADLRTHGVIGT